MSEDKKVLDEAVKAEEAKLKDAELNEEALDEVSGGVPNASYCKVADAKKRIKKPRLY